MQQNSLTLLELNTEIKGILRDNTQKRYWVVGEISELKVNATGHCYLEMIQKDDNTDQIVARSRATIWAQTFRMIRPYFETTTGQAFTEGIGIMVRVSVEFHEVFGLSLSIHDIEPAFTLGELALRKQKIIDKLTREGVIDMNRELELPFLCQRIAIISSTTAAGYGDFVDQLKNNPYGFIFYLKLFPALMQGEEAERSIIEALNSIYRYESFFDAVVIIRGGGSQADLNCYNSYWLAYHITQFPLPVLTGIGHEQDDTVTDRVAHTRLKTPTAVAAFLTENLVQLEYVLNETVKEIIEGARSLLQVAAEELGSCSRRYQTKMKDLIHAFQNRMLRVNNRLISGIRQWHSGMEKTLKLGMYRLRVLSSGITRSQRKDLQAVAKYTRLTSAHILDQRKQLLEAWAERLRVMDPVNLLDRGFSITMKEGKIIRDTKELMTGDLIETRVRSGRIESTIKKIKK